MLLTQNPPQVDSLQVERESAEPIVGPGFREMQVLQLCARSQSSSKAQAELRFQLSQPLVWQQLLTLGVRHRVLPLLYQHLSQFEGGLVPPQVLTALQTHCQENVEHNLRQTWVLLQLLEQFEQQQLAVIPFKGPLLAATVYQDLGLRRFTDLDLLIHPQQKPEAEALLQTAGYQLQQAMGWESSWIHEQQQVAVDLHWAIAPDYFPLAMPFEQLRSRLCPVELGGRAIGHLSPEDLLLVLCNSFCRDSIERKAKLSQLCDIAELLRTHPDLDWAYLFTQTYQMGIHRVLYSSLHLAHELLEAPLPEIFTHFWFNSLGSATGFGTARKSQGEAEGASDWPGQLDSPRSEVYPIQLKDALLLDKQQRSPQEPWWSADSAHNHSLALQLRDRRRDQLHYLLHNLADPMAGSDQTQGWGDHMQRLPELLWKYSDRWVRSWR
jgi:hypothetical protein